MFPKLFAYNHGRPSYEDRTFLDTFAYTNADESAAIAVLATNAAEIIKRRKYGTLTEPFQFEAVAIAMANAYNDGTMNVSPSRYWS